MATTYTKTEENSIHLLNDRNISDALSGDGVPKFNAIPSLDLFSKELGKINDGVDTKLEKLKLDDIPETSKFVTSVSQKNGKISVSKERPKISDVSGLVDRLSAIESGYLKKNRDENVKSLSVEENLMVGGFFNTTNIKTKDNLVTIDGTMGADGKKHGELQIDFEGGLDSVKVNGKSLQSTLNDTVSSLSSGGTEVGTGEIISSISQIGGVITTEKRTITSDDIPNLPQSKIDDLETEYLKKENFKTTLKENSNEFLTDDNIEFEELTREDDGKHVVRLKNTSTGKTLDIDCSSFVKDGMVKEVTVNYAGDTEHPNPPYLVIKWNDDAGGSITWLSVQDILHDIYKVQDGDDGIKIKNYEVSLNYDVVTKRSLFDDVQKYVDDLRGTSGSDTGIIHELSGDVKTAIQNDIRQVKFDGIIKHVEDGNTIIDVLRNNHDIASETQVRNNSIYPIRMTDDGLSAPESEFVTADGYQLRNGNLIVIHDADASKETIKFDDLTKENIRIFKMGVDFKEFNDEVNARKAGDTTISVWLENQFNTDNLNKDIIELEIKKDIKVDKNLKIDDKKLKYSDGYTANDVKLSVEDLCAYVEDLCAYIGDLDNSFEVQSKKKISKITQSDGKIGVECTDLVPNEISGIDTYVDDRIINKINDLDYLDSVKTNEFVTSVTETNGKISVSRARPIISNVQDLCATIDTLSSGIDRKISIGTITGQTVDVNKSDLSVVKINNADYKNLVIEGKISENCIYVISDDYDDAMGHQLCNLAMPDDADGKYTGCAATSKYVDAKDLEVATGVKAQLKTIVNSVESTLTAFSDTRLSAASLDNVFTSLNMMYKALKTIGDTLK